MKKRVISIIIILILSILVIPTFAEGIVVKLNNEPIIFDVQPVILEGRTMVPLRAIFESLGAQVSWDNDTKTIYGSRGNTMIILQVDNNKAFVNSTELWLDVAPQIINSRTLVPARFIAEALNANVVWDATTSTVLISTDGTSAATK